MKKNVFLDVKNKQKSYFYFDVNIFSWIRKGTKVINAKRMDGHQLFTKKRQKSHPYTQKRHMFDLEEEKRRVSHSYLMYNFWLNF